MAAALRQSYSTSGSKVQTGVAVQAGDIILVFFYVGAGVATTSCADSAGNTYTQLGTGGLGSSCSGYGFKATAAASGTLTITITTANTSSPGIFVHVISGATTASVHSFKNESTAGTSHATNAVTAVDGAYVAAFWFQNYASSTTMADANGFTSRQTISPSGTGVWDGTFDKVFTTGGSVSHSMTSSKSCKYGSLVVALEPASSGPTYNPSCMMAAF